MNREKVLRFNSSSIHLEYYGPAHTDGDIFAHFLEADIFHTGDTWWNGYYPFIDYSTGGSIDGSIRAVETNLAKTTEEMIIIPGHGPIGRKSDLRIYLDLLVAARDRISILKRQGRSLPEVIAAKPTAGYDEKWGGGLINRANFTGLVYEGV